MLSSGVKPYANSIWNWNKNQQGANLIDIDSKTTRLLKNNVWDIYVSYAILLVNRGNAIDMGHVQTVITLGAFYNAQLQQCFTHGFLVGLDGDVDHEVLWANLKYFLEALMPTCEETGIKMAIHMDDPPWDIFGLPRLLISEENIDRFLSMVDHPNNCLTLCSGSLNADPNNNVANVVRKHCDRIAFAHIRNVKHFDNGDFSEASHRDCDGETGILEILKAYHECGYEGYIRPDHGRHLWNEGPGTVRPGYGLYDRALGIMYMLGAWDLLDNQAGK